MDSSKQNVNLCLSIIANTTNASLDQKENSVSMTTTLRPRPFSTLEPPRFLSFVVQPPTLRDFNEVRQQDETEPNPPIRLLEAPSNAPPNAPSNAPSADAASFRNAPEIREADCPNGQCCPYRRSCMLGTRSVGNGQTQWCLHPCT